MITGNFSQSQCYIDLREIIIYKLMESERFNFDRDDILIEELLLSEENGSDPSIYDILNEDYIRTLNFDYLNSPVQNRSAPTHLRPIYPPEPLDDAQMPSLALENELLNDFLASQPIRNEQGIPQPDDEILNLQVNEEMNEQDSTQIIDAHEPIPLRSAPPKITHFKMLKKDDLRNIYGLTMRQSHKSLDNPKNLRFLQKICARYRNRLGNISARDVRQLNIHKRNWTIQSGQIASYFYVPGADYTENCKRYLFGKYFMWYGRNRYALDVLNNKRLKTSESRQAYFQTMSTFVQQVPHILEMFETSTIGSLVNH